MPDVVKSNLGPVTAYADAVKHGYTGSREDFGNLLAGAGKNLTDAVAAKDAAQKAATDAASYKQSAADSLQGAQTAQSAAEKAVEDASAAKNAAETAKAGAEAAKTAAGEQATAAATSATAAENSNTAAKNSADAAAASSKSASDTAGSIKDSLDQIAENKEATSALKDGKISKFYANSQGNTNLPDSDGGRIVDLKLYGKSEQKQYSGKNLLDLRNGKSDTGEGVTYTKNSDGSYIRKGTATGENGNVWFDGGYGDLSVMPTLFTLKAGTYTVKDCLIFSGTNAVNGNNYTFTIYNDSPITGVRNDRQAVGTTYNDTVYPRVFAGDTDTGWEPYVGGIPSPNPEYPQEIKSVVKPMVKVTGKNLLDLRAGKSGTGEGVTYTQNGDGSYTRVGTPTGVGGNVWFAGGYGSNLPAILTLPAGTYTSKDCVLFTDALTPLYDTFTLSTITSITGIRNPYQTSASYSDTIYPRLEVGSTDTGWQPYTESTATLPYTLNAIPVSSGGNVTIDGQQYIADYVDVEKGKLVRMVDSSKLDTTQSIIGKTDWLLATPTETDLTADEIAAFKALASHYPVTNVSTTSDQLDGYTVFNYPISLAKGYDYIKQQLGDTRDYLYGIDLMTAEAYVNSEYAAALAEIEV